MLSCCFVFVCDGETASVYHQNNGRDDSLDGQKAFYADGSTIAQWDDVLWTVETWVAPERIVGLR